MSYMTQTAFAEKTGRSPATIGEWVSRGVLNRNYMGIPYSEYQRYLDEVEKLKDYNTLTEVAEITGIPYSQVSYRASRGDFPTIKSVFGGRGTYVHKDVVNLMKQPEAQEEMDSSANDDSVTEEATVTSTGETFSVDGEVVSNDSNIDYHALFNQYLSAESEYERTRIFKSVLDQVAGVA